MTALAYRLLERFLPSASADAVVGDLMERGVSGVRLWRETAVAISAPPRPNSTTGRNHVHVPF